MKIGLVGIVKDERSIIERMFSSVEEFIDEWLLVDTGSTDGTVEYLKERGDGTVEQRPWVDDFSASRNEALDLAQSLDVDYLLLFDADLVLQPFVKLTELTGEVYDLEHVGGDFHYWVPRLMRKDANWRFVGRTHEYLRSLDGDESSREYLYAWQVRDYADGHSRLEKSERDLRLLTEDWNDMSSHVDKRRVASYLANTCAALGDKKSQLEWLRKRIDMGGPDDQLFYYRYQIADVLGDPEEMLSVWGLCPDRAEPLAWLGQFFNVNGDFERAYHFGNVALSIPYPENAALVSPTAYDYDTLFQVSVAAFNTGRIDEAISLGRQLLSRNLPDGARQAAEANLAEYLTFKEEMHG